MKIKPLLLLTASLLAMINLQAQAGVTKLLAKLPPMELGQGYSTDTSAPAVRSCFIAPSTHYAGASSGFLALGNQVSATDIQRDLTESFSQNANIGIFSENSSASYARHITNNNYSDNFSFLSQVTFPQETTTLNGIGTAVLNDTGKAFYQLGPTQFRISCGDSYVKSQSLGADLFVTLQINFASITDKEDFDASLGASVGNVFDASANIQQAVNESHAQGTVEISAFQLGGVPSQLSNILQKDSQGNYYVTQCSLNDLSACNKAINGIIEYAQNNFANQVAFKNGKISGPGTPAVLSNGTVPDETAFALNTGSPLVTPAIQAARRKLAGLYQSNSSHLIDVTHLLKSPVGAVIENDLKNQVISLQSALQDNTNLLSDYQNGGIQCYLQPQQCVNIANNINAELEPTDLSILKPLQYYYVLADHGPSETTNFNLYPTGNPKIFHGAPGAQIGSAQFSIYSPTSLAVALEFLRSPSAMATFKGTRYSTQVSTYRGDLYFPLSTYQADLIQKQNPYYPIDIG